MMNRALLVLGAMAVAFVAGYLPQNVNIGRLTDELEESAIRYERQVSSLEDENQILQLQRDLGMLWLEVEARNYGRAMELSTDWFDQLANAAASSSDPETRRSLTGLLGGRDAMTMLLTEGDEGLVVRIRDMYRTLTPLTSAD